MTTRSSDYNYIIYRTKTNSYYSDDAIITIAITHGCYSPGQDSRISAMEIASFINCSKPSSSSSVFHSVAGTRESDG